jgi:hypothetical protein
MIGLQAQSIVAASSAVSQPDPKTMSDIVVMATRGADSRRFAALEGTVSDVHITLDALQVIEFVF